MNQTARLDDLAATPVAPRASRSLADRAWLVAGLLVAGLTLLPVGALVVLAAQPTGDVWNHLMTTVLPRSLRTTFLLLLGVGLITFVIGTGTAWLVTMCRFPGRRLFDWALLLPLAVPTYIIAYTYVEILTFTGPVQSLVRDLFGFRTSREYWFPEIRSLGGAIFVMGFVLYPYVYLTTRAALLLQSASTLDVSRTLGAGPMRLFFRVALPLARPAIVVGISLALMECLNDIGAVTFFGVHTLSFSVYDTWVHRSSLAGAAQIACAMMALVFALLWMERRARKGQNFHTPSTHYRTLPSYRLTGGRAWLATAACALPILIGFVFPAALLADYASRRLDALSDPRLISAIKNTLTLSVSAALLTVVIGVVLTYAHRVQASRLTQLSGRIASIGYAIPGTVLAVGILIPLANFDNFVDGVARSTFGVSTGLLLIGSGTALVYAYMIRFLAVSYGQIESGFGKVTPHLDMAARTLGRSSGRILFEVHLPILRPVLLTALLLAFVDCMKELPATILLRPFNFETLATTVYGAASREAFGEGALPALLIVLVGLVPSILLARTSAVSFRDKASTRRL